MIVKRSTCHYWSPEDVTRILDSALRTLAEMDVPEDLRPAFFTAAVGLISSGHHEMEQTTVPVGGLAVVPKG